MHNRISDRAIWPNQCLPWLMLDIDERIKIIQNSKVFCRICLWFLGIGATSKSCGKGRHLVGNGRNTSCVQFDCDNNVTLCRRHERINAEKHRLYKSALRWKQGTRTGQSPEDDDEKNHSYLMTVTEETETKGVAELNDMVETRKEIHLKQGTDITNIFRYQSTTVNGINNGETN